MSLRFVKCSQCSIESRSSFLSSEQIVCSFLDSFETIQDISGSTTGEDVELRECKEGITTSQRIIVCSVDNETEILVSSGSSNVRRHVVKLILCCGESAVDISDFCIVHTVSTTQDSHISRTVVVVVMTLLEVERELINGSANLCLEVVILVCAILCLPCRMEISTIGIIKQSCNRTFSLLRCVTVVLCCILYQTVLLLHVVDVTSLNSLIQRSSILTYRLVVHSSTTITSRTCSPEAHLVLSTTIVTQIDVIACRLQTIRSIAIVVIKNPTAVIILTGSYSPHLSSTCTSVLVTHSLTLSSIGMELQISGLTLGNLCEEPVLCGCILICCQNDSSVSSI